MRKGAGGQNCGEGCRGYSDHAADAAAASLHPPSMANVHRALQCIVTELQQQRQAVPSNAGAEADRASVGEDTSAHLSPPALRASISNTDVTCSAPPNTAKQRCERRRLLFLAQWAQRVAKAYAPIMPSVAEAVAASLQSVCTTLHDDLTGDEAERKAVASPSLPTNAHRRLTETAVAASVADSPLNEQDTTCVPCTDEDLPSVRCPSLPVERRLSYTGVYSNAHDVTPAPVSATPESYRALLTSPSSEATSRAGLPLLEYKTTAAPAAMSSFSPPPPFLPRGHAPLCRVVGAAFDVPTSRAAQHAVLAAQGGCCARCGVVLPQPSFRYSEWCSALTLRLRERLSCSSCCLQRCRGGGGGGQATVSPSCRGKLWHACLCISRRSSSGNEEADRRSAATAAAHVTQETISGNSDGPEGIRSHTSAPRDPRNSDNVSTDEAAADAYDSDGGLSATSEHDLLLGGRAQEYGNRRVPAARRNRSSVSLMPGAVASRWPTPPPASAHAASSRRRSDGTGDRGGGTSVDAPFLFCTYEGHYLCLRCFHAPLKAAGFDAAMSVPSAVATSALGCTFIPEDYQTRCRALEGWPARDELTTHSLSSSAQLQSLWRGNGGGEDAEESPARAVPGRESEPLHERWLARHVAQLTPAPSSLSPTGSRAASGLDQLPPQQCIASPLHMCVLPAHVLHRWDFARFPVSAAAAAKLRGRCYPDNASNQESGPSPWTSHLKRGEQRTTASGSGGVSRRRSDEGRQIRPSREEQGVLGCPRALARPSLLALEHVPYHMKGSDERTPPMAPLPELYDVSVINPSLYKRVPALALASRLRQRMSLLHAQAQWCPRYRHEVWGLRSGDAWTSEAPEGATVFPVVQQPSLPRSTTVHSAERPPRPAAMAESVADSGEAHLVTQELSPPPPLSSATAAASRPHSVATLQTACHAAQPGQTQENLSGGTAGTSPTPAGSHARRRYLVERAEGWSLQDLHRLNIPSPPSSAGATTTASLPPLLAELHRMLSTLQTHVSGCSRCAAQCRGSAGRAPFEEGSAGVL